jgi:hypothetical protein
VPNVAPDSTASVSPVLLIDRLGTGTPDFRSVMSKGT